MAVTTGGDVPAGHRHGGGDGSAPATIVVSLQENAKLTVEDYVNKSTSATRTFQTQNLPMDKEFTYSLTVEVVRDGKVASEKKDITVRGGQITRATFDSS